MLLKTVLATTLLALGAAEVDPFAFQPPLPKTSQNMYEEAVKAYNAGNPNAKLFLDKSRIGYNKAQSGEGRTEPEDVYMGCLLYQVGGLKALDSINFAHTARVLAGGPKEGQENSPQPETYQEADALAIRDSFSAEQMMTAQKLWMFWPEYAADCYRYTHSGYIVMPHLDT